MTIDLKKLLNKKKGAFGDGGRELLRSVQREMEVRLRERKEAYRKKLQSNLQQNNMQDVCSGIKNIMGFKVKGDQAEGSLDKANKLNLFFNRFSTGPSSSSSSSSPVPSHTDPTPSLPPQLLPSHTSHLPGDQDHGLITLVPSLTTQPPPWTSTKPHQHLPLHQETLSPPLPPPPACLFPAVR